MRLRCAPCCVRRTAAMDRLANAGVPRAGCWGEGALALSLVAPLLAAISAIHAVHAFAWTMPC